MWIGGKRRGGVTRLNESRELSGGLLGHWSLWVCFSFPSTNEIA
jgi:hypothetical protein